MDNALILNLIFGVLFVLIAFGVVFSLYRSSKKRAKSTIIELPDVDSLEQKKVWKTKEAKDSFLKYNGDVLSTGKVKIEAEEKEIDFSILETTKKIHFQKITEELEEIVEPTTKPIYSYATPENKSQEEIDFDDFFEDLNRAMAIKTKTKEENVEVGKVDFRELMKYDKEDEE